VISADAAEAVPDRRWRRLRSDMDAAYVVGRLPASVMEEVDEALRVHLNL